VGLAEFTRRLLKSRLQSPLAATAEKSGLTTEQLYEVQAFMAQNNKIFAIRLVRSINGWGLKEAKEFVEGLPPLATARPPKVKINSRDTEIIRVKFDASCGCCTKTILGDTRAYWMVGNVALYHLECVELEK